jgi:hypothetical protein
VKICLFRSQPTLVERCPARQVKLHNPGLTTTAPQGKCGQRHWQGEAPRTGAAGIDEENLAALLDRRLVRMAEDYSSEARGGRIEIELCEVVKNVNRVAADLDNVECRKAAGPRILVVVAADRADRSEGSERVEDGGIADVATMNDHVRVAQRIECRGPNQTMGIRDKADTMKPIRHVMTGKLQQWAISYPALSAIGLEVSVTSKSSTTFPSGSRP